MLSNPHPHQPVFGLVTNGDEFRFIKLLQKLGEHPQFDLSDLFPLMPPHRSRLHQMLQVLKHMNDLLDSELA